MHGTLSLLCVVLVKDVPDDVRFDALVEKVFAVNEAKGVI